MATKLILCYTEKGEALADTRVEGRYHYWVDLIRRTNARGGMPGDWWNLSYATMNIFYRFYLGYLLGEIDDIEVMFVDETNQVEVPIAEAWNRKFFTPVRGLISQVEEQLLKAVIQAPLVINN